MTAAGTAGPGAGGPAGTAERWGLADRCLYLCTPDRPDLERFVGACIEGGVDVVQLREKYLPDRDLLRRAGILARLCADAGVPFVLNDRPDLAVAAGADGVHVGQEDTPPAEARQLVGHDRLVGLSTHAAAELEAALGAPVDYLSAGPVVETPTKPGRAGTGLDYVRLAVERATVPVWVTGGVRPDTVGELAAAGVRHFVVVRWLTEAADPRAAAAELRAAVHGAIEQALAQAEKA